MHAIPVRPVGADSTSRSGAADTAYRWFVATSLAVAIGGGFMLAIVISLAGALEARWSIRTLTLTQAHGQLQLLGFAGVFVAGMALRLMPRISGHKLMLAEFIYPMLVMLGGGSILRAIAQPSPDAAARDAAMLASAFMILAGASMLALITLGTLLTSRDVPSATSMFFAFGVTFLVAGSLINLSLTFEILHQSRAIAPPARQAALTFLWQYGFILMFIAGVATRAVPALSGRPRPERSARVAAIALALGVALSAGAMLVIASTEATVVRARAASAGLLVVAVALLSIAWLSGALTPRPSRVAPASRQTFWFVRSAIAWLVLSAVLLGWYASRGLLDARLPDQFALDAVRHALALGVITMMIVGIGMLILPEFAGRRMQHRRERPLIWTMLIAANAAVILRLWPSWEGVHWLESSRYWPMATAGILSLAVLVAYAAMFAQSYLEQRTPGWNSAVTARAHRPGVTPDH